MSNAPAATATATLADLADAIRTAERARRGIYRNDGRTRATTRALARHQAITDAAFRELTNRSRTDRVAREVVGLLIDETRTALRLMDSDRPELRARQVATRRRLRALLAT